MKNIPTINIGKVTISSISRKEFNSIMKNAISEWHFERSEHGVKPVKGRFDPTNSNHVPKNNVVSQYRYGERILFRE